MPLALYAFTCGAACVRIAAISFWIGAFSASGTPSRNSSAAFRLSSIEPQLWSFRFSLAAASLCLAVSTSPARAGVTPWANTKQRTTVTALPHRTSALPMTCPFPQRIAGTDARNVPEHKQHRSQNAARRTAPPFRTRLYRDEQAHAREHRDLQLAPLALSGRCSIVPEIESGIDLQVHAAPLAHFFVKEGRHAGERDLMDGDLFGPVPYPRPGPSEARGKKHRDDLV